MKKVIIILSLTVTFAFGQHFDAKSLSLAGNSSAFIKGIDALAWNPANLATPRGNVMELNIISFNAALYNSSFSIGNYNKYFTEEGHGGYWSTSEKNEILDLIPDDGLSLRMNESLNLFGFAFNNFGIGLQWESMGRGSVNAEYPLEMALFGENIDTTYGYSEDDVADADGYSAIKMTVGYAYPVKAEDLFDLDDYIRGLEEISFGVNLNYYLGLATYQITESKFNGRRVNSEVVEYNLKMTTESVSTEGGFPTGTGVGFDFGVSAKYKDDFRFSVAFKNILAGINWTVNPERNIIISRDSTKIDDDLSYKERKTIFGPDVVYDQDSTISISSFRTPLPKYLIIGAQYAFLENLKFTMDWHQGLDSNFGNSTTPRIGFGTQYLPLNWLALRGGFSIGGQEGFLFGLGGGLNFTNFEFDLAYGMNKTLWPAWTRGIFLATGIKVKF